MDELTIVTFLWQGDRWKVDTLANKYVNILHRSVNRNLRKVPFRFVLFSNVDGLKLNPGIECRSFDPPSWKGCLPRLWMYNREACLHGRCLALDLDIIITSNFDDIGSYQGDFCVRSKFKPGEEWKADGDIIGFRPEKCRHIWERFVKDPMEAERFTGGRERYFYREVDLCIDRWQNLYPNRIVSYKRHIKTNLIGPYDVAIVSCHGEPRPHEIKEPWARSCWR